MDERWARRPLDPVMEMHVPRLYGSTPTLFGAPLAEDATQLGDADVAFIGIPWRAPTPDSRAGSAGANFESTLLTPGFFRTSSMRYGGYLPELDVDVFDVFRLADFGDVQPHGDMAGILAGVEQHVKAALDAGCSVVTMGGNAGPSSYAVLKAIADGCERVAVLNLDAHSDNSEGEWQDDDPRAPRWGSTWALRILGLPGVDPSQYFHFGLRGPRNDSGVFDRFAARGVPRENIVTYRELKAARRRDYDAWAEGFAADVVRRASKLWIAVDGDVLDLSSNPEWADEPLGPRAEEVIQVVYEACKAAGPERFAGLSFMAVPHDAPGMHAICLYVLLYALAGIAASQPATAPGPDREHATAKAPES